MVITPQDFKAFSDESFDAVNWINESFASGGSDAANKESYASNLVYKLQLIVQEINGSLEETAQQVIYNLPKVLQEAELLQDDANNLKQELTTVRQQMSEMNESTLQTLETLKVSNSVKQRMDQTLHQSRLKAQEQ